MAQGCLKFLKYTMCVANFLCFMCGVALMGLGGYLMATFKMEGLVPSLASLNIPSLLLICGIVITCLSFLGFLGALKENRCLLFTFFLVLFLLMLVELTAACLMLWYERKIQELLEKDLKKGLNDAKQKNSTDQSDWNWVHSMFKCCGVNNYTDWGDPTPKTCCKENCDSLNPTNYKKGCLEALNEWFEENYLFAGITVISICIVEVLGMCFAVTLFCHITSSGLGYKL
ncbi:leukocyte surface antigen CD53 [Oryzias latipes]|uniref:Tetraspanin n=1 Tax=Oryzias latipes TaxID=8090 RepID=H2MQB6_ORYLA|nr:leukocyte surface antigen CD53 [Oryzias latipes]